MDRLETVEEETVTSRQERMTWERPVLSEATLRHFTDMNLTGGEDNQS